MPNWVINSLTFNGTKSQLSQIIEKYMPYDEAGDNCFDLNSIVPMPESLNITAGGWQEEAIQAYLTMLSPDCDFFESAFGIKPLEAKLSGDGFWLLIAEATHKSEEHCRSSFSKPKLMYMSESELSSFAEAIIRSETSEEEKKKKKAEMIAFGKAAFENIRLYGHADWYGWCNENWGTKWNASETCVSMCDGTLVVYFNTAWSSPIPALVSLSEQIKDDKDLKGVSFELVYADEDRGSNTGILTFDEEENLNFEAYESMSEEAIALYAELWQDDEVYDEDDE